MLIQIPSRPNCGTKANISSTAPRLSNPMASPTTTFSTWVAWEKLSAETLSPSRRSPRKPILRRMASAKKLVSVTSPRPPIWISASSTNCPKAENWVQVSRTTSPVTQVALVAVNMASSTPRRPLRLEIGRVSSSVPAAITTKKLTQMIWVALRPASHPPLLRGFFCVLFAMTAPLHPLRAALQSGGLYTFFIFSMIHLFSLGFNRIFREMDEMAAAANGHKRSVKGWKHQKAKGLFG